MRAIRFIGLVAALVVAGASPALAHAELDKSTGVAGANVSLTMHVPVEGEGLQNVKVIIEVPRPFELHSCSATGGWTCVIADEPESTHTLLTYAPGAPGAPDLEDFTFDVKAPDEDGDYAIEVNQIYSNGTVVQWSGDPDSETPAALFRVGAGGEVGPAPTLPADTTTTSPEVAVALDDVADNETASEKSEKKDPNMAALYIVIALWLAVVIPVLIDGVKGPQTEEAHTPHHE